MSHQDPGYEDGPPTGAWHAQWPPEPGRHPVVGTHHYGDGVSEYPLYGGGGADYSAPPVDGVPHRDPYEQPSYWQEPSPPVNQPLAERRPPAHVATTREPASPGKKGNGRAGRNLPAAIGVGVGLGAAVLLSLFVWRPAFVVVVAAAAGIGVWEMARAVRTRGANPPLLPLLSGAVLMSGLAWWGRTDALIFGLIVTVLAAMVWRLSDGAIGYERDVAAAAMIAVYVPFLAGFAVLLAQPSDGDLRVIVTLAGVVLSDTGGYVAGVLFGRRPMAPTVSPKKSWEGLAGSLVATAIGGALLVFFLFDVAWWWGALFGLAVSAASVLGDLGESMIKRDLGVKDMSNLLPGHGGLMDRLDSILFAAPTAFALLTIIAPPV